jgi:hypothetical protein
MTKIILKEVSEGVCRWFCDNCNQQIDNVPENLFSRPLIDKCPHCGITFSDYELCKIRIDMQNQVFAEFGIVNPDKK